MIVALLGIVLQFTIFRWMEGQDLRQTLVTIGISIVLADLMLWRWGGDFYQVPMPAWLGGPVEVPLVTAMRSNGEAGLPVLSAGAARDPARARS